MTYPIFNQSDLINIANYTASGPQSSGQNLQGFDSIELVKLRPNGQPPYVLSADSTVVSDIYYFLPIFNIQDAGAASDDLLTVTFSAAQPTAPFEFGDFVTIDGVTPADYDGSYTVYSCTTTTVTVQMSSAGASALPVYLSGGDIGRNFENFNLLTDAQATVTVTGGTDRVIVSAQAEIELTYSDPTVFPYELDIVVQILRFAAQPPDSPFRYIQSGVVSQRIFHIQDNQPVGIVTVEPVFVNVIDGPNLDIGTYLYVMAVSAVNRPDVDKSGYQTRPAELLDNGFTGLGQINQSIIPGTTFAGIVPTITGTGTSCSLDITIQQVSANNPNYNIDTALLFRNTEVVVTANSGDFSIGDQLTVLGTDLGGTTPANDLILSVSQTQYPGYVTMNTCLLGYRSLTAAVIKQ